MYLTEIYRVPQSLYKGGAEDLTLGVTDVRLREYFRNTKPLPGKEPLRYKIMPSGKTVQIVIIDPNVKTQVIAELILKPKRSFPIPNSYEISVANIDERYRGQGLIFSLYDIVLDELQGHLISSTAQTPGGRKTWTKLIQDPNVEAVGLAMVPAGSFSNRRQVNKVIEEIMKIGAVYLGVVGNVGTGTSLVRRHHLFSFPVETAESGSELANAIPDSKIRLYNSVSSIIKTGLMASRRPVHGQGSLSIIDVDKELGEEATDTMRLPPASNKAQDWIEKVYQKYPHTWQNNHVMTWGEGDQQELAMFELEPSKTRRDAVEVKWFQAYPLRQGIGSRAMRELQQLAREDGVALTLYAWDKGQVSRSQLMKFYRRMGFNPVTKKSASMVWNPDQLDEVNIDNRAGAGAVPYNTEVDYFGLRVMMRPSIFLKLAAPLGQPHNEKLEQYIAQGGAIGSPFIMVDIPEAWEDGDFSQLAEVTGHEGRNRVSAVLKLEGDAPIEMHLFPRYLRRRHLTSQWIEALNRGLTAEHSGRVVPGPLFDDATLEEGWREKAAAAATAATLAYGGMHNATPPQPGTTAQPGVTQNAIQKAAPNKPAAPKPFVLQFTDKNPIRDYLVQRGHQAGFSDIELAHLVSQVQHETMDFKHLEELGTPKYFARKYDKKYNPRKAKILGNVKPGDGERYKGRGFVHLTGRDNYTRAGQALGIDLANKPYLAADPKVAADVAVWFWKNRVQPKVGDFPAATVTQVTKPINPGLRGLSDREAKFMKITNR